MRAIQNEDVKSLSDLESQGGSKENLIHDSKIYVTAKGIQKTLAEIIESGEIADGNRFGADYKNYAIGMTDGSTEEYNMDVPFAIDGHTFINLFFDVKELEVAQLHVGGEYYTKWISDEITPNKYWKWISETKIAIHGDLTSQALPISFIVLRGSEIPVVPSVFAGLKIEHQAYGITNSSTGTNISGIFVQDNKTTIHTSFHIKPTDIVFVFIDNQFYPTQSPVISSTGKWYRVLQSNLIQLGSDLSSTAKTIYIAVLQGRSMVDAHGNMIVTLKPSLTSIVLSSPNGQKWNIASSVYGELEIESDNSNSIPFKLLTYNESNDLVEVTVSDDGELVIDTPVGNGIVFDKVYLSDVEGNVWEMYVDSNNILYTIENGGNKHTIQRSNGTNIKTIQGMSNNMTYEITGYGNEDSLSSVTSTENMSLITSLVRDAKGYFGYKAWDTVRQRWSNIVLKIGVPVGGAIDWFGTKDKIPSDFIIADGSWLSIALYADLYDIYGKHYGYDSENMMFRIPDTRGLFVRCVDDERGMDTDALNRTAPFGDSDTISEIVGSFQDDEIKSHKHYYLEMYPYNSPPNGGTGQASYHWNPRNTGSYTGSTGGAETRPKNIYAYKIIRAR